MACPALTGYTPAPRSPSPSQYIGNASGGDAEGPLQTILYKKPKLVINHCWTLCKSRQLFQLGVWTSDVSPSRPNYAETHISIRLSSIYVCVWTSESLYAFIFQSSFHQITWVYIGVFTYICVFIVSVYPLFVYTHPSNRPETHYNAVSEFRNVPVRYAFGRLRSRHCAFFEPPSAAVESSSISRRRPIPFNMQDTIWRRSWGDMRAGC